jgi:hypothetical protein
MKRLLSLLLVMACVAVITYGLIVIVEADRDSAEAIVAPGDPQ